MVKQFLKKKFPKLVVVEGFWHIGKTEFILSLLNRHELEFIKEPDHLTEVISNNISNWYYRMHKQRINKAIENLRLNKKVIMERSIISNMALMYAKTGELPNNSAKKMEELDNDNCCLVFLYGSKKFVRQQAKHIKDDYIKELILNNKNFYKNYVSFYKNILPNLINNKVISIKIDKNSKFKTNDNILNIFYNQLPKLKKEKVSCSSIVGYNQDKVLLLYDYNYKHYVLPQGHQEKNECLKNTAIREFGEETGFLNVKMVRKLKKYQYHYPAKDAMVYKSIHVYLINILNLSKSKKRLENHEKYSNRFFTIEEAVKKAAWNQDKEMLTLAKKYI